MLTIDPFPDNGMVQCERIVIRNEHGMRRMIAKALAQAIKEATGRVQVSGKKKKAAKRFIATEWAFLWACYLGHEEDLIQLCIDLELEPEMIEWKGGVGL